MSKRAKRAIKWVLVILGYALRIISILRVLKRLI